MSNSAGIANVSNSTGIANVSEPLEEKIRLLERHVQEHCERVQEQILFNRKLQNTITELQEIIQKQQVEIKAMRTTIEMLSTRACL